MSPASRHLAAHDPADTVDSSDADLQQAACWLADRYHQHPRLVDEQRDFCLRLALLPSDDKPGAWLHIRDGRICDIRGFSDGPGTSLATQAGALADAEPPVDVLIRGPQRLLCDIVRLRQSPSEPYLFGELVVSGCEPDFLRLDYIITTLAHAEDQS